MHVGFVLLNCDLGAEEYILDELTQVPQIKNAYVTFGAYDVIAEIKLSEVSNVTGISLDSIKNNYLTWLDKKNFNGAGYQIESLTNLMQSTKKFPFKD